MNLYEINRKLEEALARAEFEAIEHDGEISDATAEELDLLEMDREEKIENTALYIKNLKAESAMIKAEEQKLRERRQANEAKAERLSEWLKFNLKGEKRSAGNYSISYRKSQSVEVENVDNIPEEYKTIKTSVMPLKNEIKKAILAGEEVAGAYVLEKNNMVVK